MTDVTLVPFSVRVYSDGGGFPEAAHRLLSVAMDLVDGALPSWALWGGWSPANYDEESDLWVMETTVRAAREWPTN